MVAPAWPLEDPVVAHPDRAASDVDGSDGMLTEVAVSRQESRANRAGPNGVSRLKPSPQTPTKLGQARSRHEMSSLVRC